MEIPTRRNEFVLDLIFGNTKMRGKFLVIEYPCGIAPPRALTVQPPELESGHEQLNLITVYIYSNRVSRRVASISPGAAVEQAPWLSQ
jgi:hypothetical protein